MQKLLSMEEMKKRYEELYAKMATSKDVSRMKAFGSAEHWAFNKVVELNPKLAQMWLDKLEASEWNNYLSQAEAEKIAAELQNQDGSKGAKWPLTQFESVVTSLGGEVSHEPKYNKYALWVTANMIYSDHAKSLKEIVPEIDLPKVVYKMAVERLTDIDRPRFVREYFGLV